jgi:hypothetical protein
VKTETDAGINVPQFDLLEAENFTKNGEYYIAKAQALSQMKDFYGMSGAEVYNVLEYFKIQITDGEVSQIIFRIGSTDNSIYSITFIMEFSGYGTTTVTLPTVS